MTDGPIIFFDGYCALCSGAIRFVVARDREVRFRLASLQSEVAGRLLTPLGLCPGALHSVILLHGGVALARSDAVLAILDRLPRPWRWFGVLRVVPRPVRDWVYDWVARHRHRWFGKRSRCSLPSSEFTARMIE